MKYRKWLFNSLIISLTLLLMSASMIKTVGYAKEKQDTTSTIASIEVGSLKRTEIKNKLIDAVEQWKSNDLEVTSGSISMKIPTKYFHFNIDETINEYEKQIHRPWYAFWEKEKIVHIPLNVEIDEEVATLISEQRFLLKEETLKLIREAAAYLGDSPVEAPMLELTAENEERVALTIEQAPKRSDLHELVEQLNNQTFEGTHIYSFNELVEEVYGKIHPETMNYMASVLYSLLLQSEYDIVERHSQQKIPTYLEPGIEAAVDVDRAQDLKFVHESGFLSKLKLTLRGNELKAELVSFPTEYEVNYQAVTEREIPFRTIYRYTETLKPNETKLIQNGENGRRVKVYRTTSKKGDSYEAEEIVSRDYYPPTPEVILKGIEVTDTTESTEGIHQPSDPLSSSKEEREEDINHLVDQPSEPQLVKEDEVNRGDSTEIQPPYEKLPKGSYYDKGGRLIIPENGR